MKITLKIMIKIVFLFDLLGCQIMVLDPLVAVASN